MKSFSAALQALLAAAGADTEPDMALLVSLPTLSLRYTNKPYDITYGGSTYTSLVMVAEGISENFLTEAPAARLKLASLDGTQQGRFFLDRFRGTTVATTVVAWSSGAWAEVDARTWMCDADQTDSTEVTIRLSSSDAVEGTEVPRRATQEAGCQRDLSIGACPYRGVLTTCDKGFNTPNGCDAHFPDLCLETGRAFTTADASAGRTRIVQPKPYGAFRGGLSHRLVLG